MNGLDHFEALAEHLVEGTFERLFRPRLHPSEVARRLARAMEDGRVLGDGGQVLLPNRYWVFLNSEDHAALDAGGEAVRVQLVRFLQRLADEGGARFSGGLSVTLRPVPDLAPGQLDVRTAYGSDPGNADDTQGIEVVTQSAAAAKQWSLRLGEQSFVLGEPVVRLGRALSNDVILDDRRVSRHHAQLRWRVGTYYLSDLGSSGGTLLNGRRVRPGEEVPLAAGEVINLAGFTLIAQVEDEESPGSVSPTSPIPSSR